MMRRAEKWATWRWSCTRICPTCATPSMWTRSKKTGCLRRSRRRTSRSFWFSRTCFVTEVDFRLTFSVTPTLALMLRRPFPAIALSAKAGEPDGTGRKGGRTNQNGAAVSTAGAYVPVAVCPRARGFRRTGMEELAECVPALPGTGKGGADRERGHARLPSPALRKRIGGAHTNQGRSGALPAGLRAAAQRLLATRMRIRPGAG